MPITGNLRSLEDERESLFSHKSEEVTPIITVYIWQTMMLQLKITATERAARFRFTFPESDSSFVVIDAFD